jgi:hypothetical protein
MYKQLNTMLTQSYFISFDYTINAITKHCYSIVTLEKTDNAKKLFDMLQNEIHELVKDHEDNNNISRNQYLERILAFTPL